jgi:hypothetical protein
VDLHHSDQQSVCEEISINPEINSEINSEKKVEIKTDQPLQEQLIFAMNRLTKDPILQMDIERLLV